MLNINSITNLVRYTSPLDGEERFYVPSHGSKGMGVAFIGAYNRSPGTGDYGLGMPHLYGISIRCGVSNAGSSVAIGNRRGGVTK